MQKGIEEKCFFVGDSNTSFRISVHEYSSLLHWHKYLEILYILEGRVHVHVNGQDFIADSGTLFFINTKEEHFTDFINSEKHKILCIQFDAEILYTLGGIGHEIKYISALLNHRIKYPVYLDVRQETDILSILHELLTEGEEKKIGYEMILKADFYKLIVWYYRKAEKFSRKEIAEGIKAFENDEERLKIIFQFVSQNYMYPITTADAANYMYLSYPYFCKMFKKRMGITFMEYLNKVRMVEAKKMLMNTNLSIRDIALGTGYKDQNYFSRLFRNMFDITPSRYRKEKTSKEEKL